MRIFVAQINPIVGDIQGNTKKILASIEEARKNKADIVLFCELTLCGYPPEDLVLYSSITEKMEQVLQEIASKCKGLMVVLGLVRANPTKSGKFLYNSAAVIIDGKLKGFKDKTLLPTYDVFDERRYFEPGLEQKVWRYKNQNIGILICEDVWEHAKAVAFTQYKRDPIEEMKKLNPDVLLNLSASPYYYQKKDVRFNVFSSCAKTLNCPHIWCNQVGSNDSLVFDGYSMYLDEKGNLIQLAKGFVEDRLIVDLDRSVCPIEFFQNPIQDLYKALVLGVRDYFQKQGFQKALIGLSGGVDSALVACIAVEALGKENVFAVSMPSRFSSLASIEDAGSLTKNLEIQILDVPIDQIFQDFLNLLSPLFQGYPFDTTEENLQARIRGMILMAVSNKFGFIVLSTGNKSEMAMGYSTLYGDMCGGLGVINDVLKTNVFALCRFINQEKQIIPESILEKPPSAELRPNQKDSDTLPDYELLDQVLVEYIEEHLSVDEICFKHKLDKPFVQKLVRKIHLAEYKRRQAPPGIRVTKKSFSAGRRLPIVHKWSS